MIRTVRSLFPKGVVLLFGAIVGAIGLGVLVQASQQSAPIRGSLGSFGAFAGYNWYGSPTSVAAQWRVPAILANSPAGSASTWIAVQGPDRVFLQIGTLENRIRQPNGRLADEYFVFWSDTSVQFQAQLMDAVRPGELVAVKIAASWQVNGWQLTAVAGGQVTGASVTAATDSVDRAEWIQEDPQEGLVGPKVPYPRLSTVSMSGLRVNGQVPRLAFENAQWMSAVGGPIFAPTPLRHGAFTLASVHLSRLQQEFLSEADDAHSNSTPQIREALGLAPAAPPTPRPSRAASLLVRRALGAMRAAHSVQVVDNVSGFDTHYFSSTFSIPNYQINEELFSSGDLVGSDAFGGPGGSFIVVGKTAYAKFDYDTYSEILGLPDGRATQLSQVWLRAPKTDPLLGFYYTVGLSISYSGFEQVLAKSEGDVALLDVSYVDDQRVYDLATTKGLELWIAASGTPYLLQLQQTSSRGSFTVLFSDWNEGTHPSPPNSSTAVASIKLAP